VAEIATRLIAGVLVIAIIFVLVRPGSDAGSAVKDVSGALAKLVTSAVG
jgi:hypothetical protein